MTTEEQKWAYLIWRQNKLDAAAQWRRSAEMEKVDAERCKRHGIAGAENHITRAASYNALADSLEQEAQGATE